MKNDDAADADDDGINGKVKSLQQNKAAIVAISGLKRRQNYCHHPLSDDLWPFCFLFYISYVYADDN